MVKKGFSLVEALVVMAIISILFAVATKVITVKPKTKVQENIHGYYECVYRGTYWEKYNKDGIETPYTSVTSCKFNPPVGASFFNVVAVNSTRNKCYRGYEPNINKQLTFNVGTDVQITSFDPYETMTLHLDEEVCSEVRDYFNSLYSSGVEMYTGGTVLSGVFIGW